MGSTLLDSEPLAVLADLQEFGIPGQEVPLPAGANMGLSTPNSTFNAKRFSDVSAALPPLNEDDYLDMDLVRPKSTSSHVAPARPPPPTVPLPSTPVQQPQSRPRRPGSFDTLASLDTLGDNDFVPIKSLPVPRPRRMASSDTISSSSSRDARSDRGGMSPARGPSPVIKPSPRPYSIMSLSTEQDLLAIAEMLSPAVEAGVGEEEPIPEGPPMAELESFSDMFGEDAPVPNPARGSVSSTMSSLYSSYQRESSIGGSIYTDSDGASYFGDDLPDPSLLAAPFLQHGLRSLHLPRGSLPMPPLDDSRSLSSSTSYSSLRTPSLSRTSSVAYLSSPPTSPTSSYSPIDAPGPSSPHMSMQNSNNKLLGIIEESLHSEEGHGHARHTSEATEVVNLDDCLEESRSSQSFAPSAYQDRRQSPRSDSRGEMRSPVHSLYKSDSRSDLRSPMRYESRTEMRGTPPPRSPPPSRRMPELQRLQISPAGPSLSSAPVLDISSSSPFNQQQYAQQTRSAHPSMQRTLPFAPEPRSSSSYADKRSGFMASRPSTFSDEEQSPYAREMQSPFGNLHNSYSSEHFSSANTADFRVPHTPDTPASFQTARSPTFAHPEAKTQKLEKIQIPPPPPVPPSPVLSATSSSSSHKSIKKAVGLSKIFGKGSSDKSSKKSSESGSMHLPNQSVTSLEIGNSKTEEKRLRKEAAKARTERLAQDLAEKQRRRTEAAKAQKSTMVKEKSKKPWEEGGGMYEGISYF
ncbi:hypothetical protein L226DRAFT_334087 [Lentinus tigrinus ALCF2SS1-7]|uniref:uncharacterized protein n=1 Tax=Lentinus tigrinus ALCF2SS1-7 TaxID=1328758 RepID=UPI0011662F22|nr:hypothetical protein L226DRAFT_334087 [Lentinus tigrinus ALCF2SS1-7]